MTSRFYAAIGVLFLSAFSALSLGGQVFYFVSYILLFMLAYALLSVLLSGRLMTLTQRLDNRQVERGGKAELLISLSSSNLLPQGPVTLYLNLPDGKSEVALYPGFLSERKAGFSLRFNHIGVFDCGAVRMSVSDVFGIFRKTKKVPGGLPQMAVLPRGFAVSALPFAQMDDGRALPNRSGEDVTSPEDTRAYRIGDPFKRIHWKLSSRNQSLIVRRFEIPAPPDTLILMDCTEPIGGEGQPDGTLRLRDTLCETALAVASMQMEKEHAVRLPLYGAVQSEFHADRSLSLHLLKEELAYQLFRGGEAFERVLNLELRRMRRTGACVIITTRLDALIAEGVNHIRRSGPHVRFYLITFEAGHEKYAPYIAQMQQQMVEVNYVTPA